MAFVKIPSKIIYGSKSFTDFYYGYGDSGDRGNYIFQVKDSNNNTVYIMTDGFLKYELSGDNNLGTLEYADQQYGGEPCFIGGNWKCYYCPSKEKWILTQNAPWFGYIPKTTVDTYYDTDISAYEYNYEGDIWWEAGSLNTTPFEGQEAGRFTFGIGSSTAAEYGLSQYSDITYILTGGVANTYSKLSSGNGPCGVYENGRYVGYPTWSYPKGSSTSYVVKYGYNKWYNLEYVNIRRIDDEYLDSRWRGYLAVEFGQPNLDTDRGWYATLTQPTVGSDFTLHFFHWVWTDPDDHEQGGSIVQEDSYTDPEGETISKPDITVSWDSIRNQYTVPISGGKLLTVIDMVEAAIWR